MTFEDPTQQKKKVCTGCKREFPVTQTVCPYDKNMLMFMQKDELLGTILNDRYRVLEEVGRGGMSIVYRGLHEMMDRTVAIKMLQAQHRTDQLSIKRFQQEAQAASHLQHPHVITVYDCGVVATGQPYIVMDFLEGESLSDVIKKENHIPFQRAVPIFAQACDALDHAHQKGVIHRDLKSSNIMLVEVEGRKDFVKVVDFGIAKLTNASGKMQQNLTQTGEIFGSPIYMSPEQCLGQTLDARSDIYSMGAVLYESLTGLPPLMGDTIYATMKMHVSEMPERFAQARPDLRIPEQIEQIAFKALAKKPEQRFQSMQEFRDALEQCMRTQFDTGAMPSLLSAPPAVGFNTIAPGSRDNEDFDLSGGLFGDDPPPIVDKPSFRRTETGAGTVSPFVTGPEGGTSGRITARTTRPPSVGSETGRRTAGVRKPMASDKKSGKAAKSFTMPAWVTPRNLAIAAAALLVPALIAGVVVLLNQLGNDNPLLFTKKYDGTLFYYAPPSQTADGKEFPGMFYVKTAGSKSKMLKIDLSRFDINNHISSSQSQDFRVGALWELSGPMGPNNSLILESGQYKPAASNVYEKARESVETFIISIRDSQKIEGLLKSAWDLTSERFRLQDVPLETFLTKFATEPAFKEGFTESYLPPGSLLITEAKPTSMTFLVDGHYFLNPDSAGNTVYYSVVLTLKDNNWLIDKFENVTEQVWQQNLPK